MVCHLYLPAVWDRTTPYLFDPLYGEGKCQVSPFARFMLILWSWPEAGEFGNVIIDGPLDVRTSCEQASGDIKGIVSPINGQADVLIFPNIESGNAFYKSVSLFAKADMAGIAARPHLPGGVTVTQ